MLRERIRQALRCSAPQARTCPTDVLTFSTAFIFESSLLLLPRRADATLSRRAFFTLGITLETRSGGLSQVQDLRGQIIYVYYKKTRIKTCKLPKAIVIAK